jgi:hypothetical protein
MRRPGLPTRGFILSRTGSTEYVNANNPVGLDCGGG